MEDIKPFWYIYSMIFDLIIILIIGLFGFLGLRNGFVYSIFRFLGWIIALVGGVFLHSILVNLIKEYTLFYSNYLKHVEEVCHNFVDKYTGAVTGSVPGVLGGSLDDITNEVITNAAEKIADASFSVIIFIILVLLIKFILFLITVLFSQKYHDGFVGGVDGILGCILGVAQGIVIVLIALTLLMPLSFVISTDFYMWVSDTMSRSLFAELIYTSNPFLNLINGFMPEEFLPTSWSNTEDYQYVEKDWNNLV